MPRASRHKLPKGVTCDPGPDGKERFYLRRKGQKKVRLHGVPWSTGFMSQYSAALGGPNVVPLIAPQPNRDVKDFDWLCRQYYESSEWKALDDTLSKPARKRLFDRVSRMPVKPNSKQLFGTVALTNWNKAAFRAIRDRHAETPSMANDFIKALRVLFKWASEVDHVERNDSKEIKLLKVDNPDGYHTWIIEEVEQFESTWEVGTQERLALGLLLYTTQRASDVRQFGAKHIKLRNALDDDGNVIIGEDGQPVKKKWIVFTQHKNRNRKPVHLEIPFRLELEELIDATPGAWERETFLTQRRGKPHTRISFTKDFGEACVVAKVPGRSHGLRKAGCVRLADNGATDKEIMAISGHQTLQEVTRYTKAANQKRLAASATKKTTRGKAH